MATYDLPQYLPIVTRLEIIEDNHIVYTNTDASEVKLRLSNGGKTLTILTNKKVDGGK